MRAAKVSSANGPTPPNWSGETRDWLKIKAAEMRERQAKMVRAVHAKRSKT
jgi:hypothetical protein